MLGLLHTEFGDPEGHGHTSARSYETVTTLGLLSPLMPVTEASVAPSSELSPPPVLPDGALYIKGPGQQGFFP